MITSGRSVLLRLGQSFQQIITLCMVASPLCGTVVSSNARGAEEIDLRVKRIADGFDRPVFLTAPPSDFEHAYVIEQWTGRIIKIDLRTGSKQLLFTVTGLSTGYSYGLVGMAFHPDFATNAKFYLSLTTGGNPPTSVIREYVIDDTGTPVSPRDLLVFQQPNREHNNGWIGFGPNDHLLYITTGDGGPGFGGILPGGNPSQRLDTIFGKVLRIDVDSADPGLPYRIPDGSHGELPNPFIGVDGEPYRDSFGGAARPEIWAFGLRSPWRNSFDRLTGDLYIADTGDADWEWINYIPGGSHGGQNFRWCVMAGSHSVFGVNSEASNQDELMAHCKAETSAGPFTFPIHEYPHTEGASKCVVGGYVYRGCEIPALQGTYFFADNTDSQIYTFRLDPNSGVQTVTNRSHQLRPNRNDSDEPSLINAPSSFGEDASGELYVISYYDGVLYKIVSGDPLQDCNHNKVTDFCELGTLDLDGNGSVDLKDFALFVECFGGAQRALSSFPIGSSSCCFLEDLVVDGKIDLHDLAAWHNLFGER